MRKFYMLFIGHLLGFSVVALGVWWLAVNIAGLPDYKLFVALASLTILVLNHFRWWFMGKKIDGREALEKLDIIVVSNYLVILLILILLDFRM